MALDEVLNFLRGVRGHGEEGRGHEQRAVGDRERRARGRDARGTLAPRHVTILVIARVHACTATRTRNTNLGTERMS